MSEEKFEQTFQVTGEACLDVRNIRGLVDIRPGEDGVIQVSAVKHLESGDAKRTEVELTQDKDGTVSAVSRFPEGSIDWVFGSKPCDVDFDIRVPRKCTVKMKGISNDANLNGLEGEFSLSTVSGNLTLRDLSGKLTVNSVSGDVDMEMVDGELKLHTVSGDIDGIKVNGSIHLHTVSGDIDLQESTLPAVDADSVSGDIELETPLGEGPYRFNSISGEVQFKVPEGTQCSAELTTMSGSISTNLPQSTSSRRPGRQMVEVQGGGVKVFLNSISGELSLVS
jgi:hypothetical protein